MRLDFNILWVEDQLDAVSAQRSRIDYLLRIDGFRVDAQFATSVDQAKAFIGNDIFGDHIDLILMDYDLGSGPGGDVGIEMVRDSFPFKDIVFYSASGVQKLQQSISDGKFQGVYYSSRQELPDTVAGVFKVLVKKVLDIEHSRGIVVGATSEIDHFVNQTLLAAFAKGDNHVKERALKLISEQLKENRKTFEKETKALEALTDLALLGAYHHIYTSAHRLRLLRKLLEGSGTHSAERDFMLKYAKETMPRRNVLAHVQVVRNGFGRKLFDGDGKEITTEDMRVLRAELLTYHELFEKLKLSFD